MKIKLKWFIPKTRVTRQIAIWIQYWHRIPVLERVGWSHTSALALLRPELIESGWFNSIGMGYPVDKDGNPTPWITYPATHFLEGRIKHGLRVFEFGSGQSTLWWSTRVAQVVSCEHDRSWYETMKTKIPGNVELHYHELEYGGEYANCVLKSGNRFDIVVIDGRDRVNCASNAARALTESGVIIWDNSDRDWYQAGYDELASCGFRRLDFHGFGPCNSERWTTSVFYRDGNCLGV